jgi:hypothetical protein
MRVRSLRRESTVTTRRPALPRVRRVGQGRRKCLSLLRLQVREHRADEQPMRRLTTLAMVLLLGGMAGCGGSAKSTESPKEGGTLEMYRRAELEACNRSLSSESCAQAKKEHEECSVIGCSSYDQPQREAEARSEESGAPSMKHLEEESYNRPTKTTPESPSGPTETTPTTSTPEATTETSPRSASSPPQTPTECTAYLARPGKPAASAEKFHTTASCRQASQALLKCKPDDRVCEVEGLAWQCTGAIPGSETCRSGALIAQIAWARVIEG